MAITETKKGITEEQQQELDTSSSARRRRSRSSRPTTRRGSTGCARRSPGRSPTSRRSRGWSTWASPRAAWATPVSRMGKRMKIRGVLRDALRQKSVGIIEETAREGHRQVRQAGRDHRLHRPDDQPRPDARGQRDLRHQGARRRDLLAASALEEDVVRDRAADARSAGARRRARRHSAVPDQGQHPDVAGADGARRPDRRHRRPADGARRVQLGHAGLRRGRRQFDDDHRRDRQHRRSGAQHAPVQDLRLRLGLLGRRQPDHRGGNLRQAARAVAGRGRLPRQRRGEGRAAPRDVGRRSAPHVRHRRHRPAAAREGRRLHDSRRPQVHHRPRRRHRQGAPVLRRRSSPRCSPSTSTRASTRRSR